MLTQIQRVITVVTVALWFGGFTFYTACVLRIGSKVVGGLAQGYVTQRVTDVLQVLAAVMIAAILIEIVTHWRRAGVRMRTLQCVAWSIMVVSLVGIVIIHNKMDALIDPVGITPPDHELFSPWHQAYQFISTCLWGATVAYIVLMVRLYGAKPSPVIDGRAARERTADV